MGSQGAELEDARMSRFWILGGTGVESLGSFPKN